MCVLAVLSACQSCERCLRVHTTHWRVSQLQCSRDVENIGVVNSTVVDRMPTEEQTDSLLLNVYA